MRVALVLLLVACGGEKLSLPSDLEPLEEVGVSCPDGEGIEIKTEDRDEYAASLACARLDVDLATAYAAMSTPSVTVDAREVTTWSKEPLDCDFDDCYRILNIVEDIVTVEFYMDWGHGATGGTAEEPSQYNSRWLKSEGSEFIEREEGSAQLTVEDDGMTRIEFVHYLKSYSPGEDTDRTQNFVQDLYDRLAAEAKGSDYPTYD
jgi:hypothetical protein